MLLLTFVLALLANHPCHSTPTELDRLPDPAPWPSALNAYDGQCRESPPVVLNVDTPYADCLSAIDDIKHWMPRDIHDRGII